MSQYVVSTNHDGHIFSRKERKKKGTYLCDLGLELAAELFLGGMFEDRDGLARVQVGACVSSYVLGGHA